MSENPVPPSTPSNTPVAAVPHRRRGSGRMILWTAVIFLCGAASGWGVGLLRPHRPTMGMNPGDLPVDLIVRSMSDELLLSPEQTRKVEQEYRDRAKALREIRDDMVPRFKAEYDKLQADLKVILTDEQFKRWEIRFDAARSRMMPPPRGGGPGEAPGGGHDRGPGPGFGMDPGHGPPLDGPRGDPRGPGMPPPHP